MIDCFQNIYWQCSGSCLRLYNYAKFCSCYWDNLKDKVPPISDYPPPPQGAGTVYLNLLLPGLQMAPPGREALQRIPSWVVDQEYRRE